MSSAEPEWPRSRPLRIAVSNIEVSDILVVKSSSWEASGFGQKKCCFDAIVDS